MAASRVPKDELAALLGGKTTDQPTCGRLDVTLDDLRVDVAGVGLPQRIDADELTLTHTTRRTGRPFTLVITKTAALFEREARDRLAAERDLSEIADAGGGIERRR
ncbi:MAG TPA: hypothetical protein VLA55_06595 [Ornithinibacter sp.]|nr:hypothetical protein [Ornithinibacter sp.]